MQTILVVAWEGSGNGKRTGQKGSGRRDYIRALGIFGVSDIFIIVIMSSPVYRVCIYNCIPQTCNLLFDNYTLIKSFKKKREKKKSKLILKDLEASLTLEDQSNSTRRREKESGECACVHALQRPQGRRAAPPKVAPAPGPFPGGSGRYTASQAAPGAGPHAWRAQLFPRPTIPQPGTKRQTKASTGF